MLTIAIIASFSLIVGLFLVCVAIAVIEGQRRDRAEMRRLEGELRSSLQRLESQRGP